MGMPIVYSEAVPKDKAFIVNDSVTKTPFYDDVLATKYQKLLISPEARKLVDEVRKWEWPRGL